MQTPAVNFISQNSWSRQLEKCFLKPNFWQNSQKIYGLGGAAKSFFISQRRKKSAKKLIIVLDNSSLAEETYQELLFFDSSLDIVNYPSLDIIPFDNTAPNPKIIAERLQALNRLSQKQGDIFLFSINALLDKTISPTELPSAIWEVSKDQVIKRSQWLKKLAELGYSMVDQVQEYGEYSLRGDQMDIFCAAYSNPLRILFFDDQIESIRHFNLESQLSIADSFIEKLKIIAVSELLLSEENISRAEEQIAEYHQQQDFDEYEQLMINVRSKHHYGGQRRLLPLYTEPADILDYIDDDFRIVLFEPQRLKDSAQYAEEEIAREWQISKNQGWLTADKQDLYINWQDLLDRFSGKIIEIHSANEESADYQFFTVDNQIFQQLADTKSNTVADMINNVVRWYNEKVAMILVASSETNQLRIKDLLATRGIETVLISSDSQQRQLLENPAWQKSILIFDKKLTQGCRLLDEFGKLQFALITESELFGFHQRKAARTRSKNQNFTDLSELSVGDYVVHSDYGIAKFEGLDHIKRYGMTTDCLQLKFYGNDKLYLPVENIYLIQKYSSSSSSTPSLNKLGDSTWQTTKTKVYKSVQELAGELVELYAKRKALNGIAFKLGEEQLEDFRRQFPFEETEDQKQAIEDVLNDLNEMRPMERLICGDVGFGKTEVAMRAALKVAANGYQVAVIVPTTVLSEQHYLNFKNRFKDFPYPIGILNRFQTPKNTKNLLAKLVCGDVSIVIGTHRLLSKDVQFYKLGLLIIDEEHRFGVKQKEKLRMKASMVDTLSMSATPIPRSLQMSLGGIRDISLITTPPVNRQQIKTRVMGFDENLVKEAINRELRRGGQAFFIHNRVETIKRYADTLRKLLPNVQLKVAHGQLAPHTLEEIMSQFVQGKFPLLLATSIVESGLDISNANTIIINDADKLGLAQLYQLRGRVGRSSTQAYAYYLVARNKQLTVDAEKKLTALQEFSDLGSGFKLASHDLAIRGAGNFLGTAQSGNILLIGIEAYLKMLDDAVNELQNKEKTIETKQLKLSLSFNSYLPEDYINSSHVRLSVYREIAACSDEEQIWQYKNNLEDRFGKLPPECLTLFDSINARNWALKLSADSLDISKTKITLQLSDKLQPDVEKLLKFLNSNNGKLHPPNKTVFKLEQATPAKAACLLKNFYNHLLS